MASDECECEAWSASECACGKYVDYDERVRGDLQIAVTTLAADNARLCGILLAADKLAAAARHASLAMGYDKFEALIRLGAAVGDYEIAKAGQ